MPYTCTSTRKPYSIKPYSATIIRIEPLAASDSIIPMRPIDGQLLDFGKSPSRPLLVPSLSSAAHEYALATGTAHSQRTLPCIFFSAAEGVCLLPRIEVPGTKGGTGVYVEKTLLDAFLPFNATFSAVCLAGRPRTLHPAAPMP